MKDTQTIPKIEELKKVILEPALREEMPPLFYVYFKRLVADKEMIRLYFRQSEAILKLLQGDGKEILDVGCGFGLRSICLSLAGCCRVVGVDISEEMINGFQTLLQKLGELEIEAIKGDFLVMPFPPCSFDAVILHDAISHIRDTQALLTKIESVLRPGGVLWISDGNNDLFLTQIIRTRRGWRRSEYGPIDDSMAKFGRKVDRLCFLDARMEIIAELTPT